ncbi:splicing factor, arginine/serine-rich 15 isoform X1 [Astyanax mexicanus]|uniref:Splicing factor, arginine/serine-rich 15 isoform X1 n=1 Tax=Astyanax mexicanus TaxID=7994 RepID=A0A8T2KXY1_ASTMX|nr:splicing factor, arginine/serine-rich 15 isoform X1 [Astyanax mexicanus]
MSHLKCNCLPVLNTIFTLQLFSLMDSKPPISRAKMISITKSAIKAIKLYKHVVLIVEKFIKKCKPEYKVPGLYVVDSIVRQSRHQFGADKDVFGPRFTKNITGTFENLCLCPTEDRSKIVRVLNLWQKNGVFKIEVIQPLLDMAAGSSSSGGGSALDNGPDMATCPPSPAKEVESQPVVSANSVQASMPQLQNSDAFAAVAQLFQSSQGQQLQQMLQTFQQPGKPQSPALENNMTVNFQMPTPVMQPVPGLPPGLPHAPLPVEKKATFDKKLLDRFDYDDEPEGGDDGKKDEAPSIQPAAFGFPEGLHQPQQVSAPFPPQASQMQHFQQHMMGVTPDQQVLPPNGQLQNFNRMRPQLYPGMIPPVGQLPTAVPHGFPGAFPPPNDAFSQFTAVQQHHQEASMDLDPSSRHHADGRRSRSRSGSRSPKRRRSRSNSRSRRSRHRRSRSRSRERRRHSPRSRSQERRERDKERERRQKGLPLIKPDTLSVCSTTLWVGQLDKRTQQQDVACLLEEFGQIESINMIPPRGCAYIVMVHRQDAFRALQKLSRGTYKVNQKAIKIAWALNKGIKSEFKQYWDVELGVTYIPWSKLKVEDLEDFKEGGVLDTDTLCPVWKGAHGEMENTDEASQNGRADIGLVNESPAPVPVQAPPLQQVGAPGATGVPPPVFPSPMNMLPHSFPPGVPPPPSPFMRPGFNPMQMPPGFLPPGAVPAMASAGPPTPGSMGMPSVGGSGEEQPNDPGSRMNREGAEGFSAMQGMNMQSPPGLLGSRPGMMPLQRPPGMPPPHLQRFPMAPRPGMPPMPPQMMAPRGPPQMMHHREPPPSGFGMHPPPHVMRGPFPHPGPPFMRPTGPRGPDGSEDPEGRPFRGEHSGPARERDRDQEWFGGRRSFGEGRGGDKLEGRERFGSWNEEAEQRGGWDRTRERRDWRRSPDGEREQGREQGREGEERPKRRDRESGTRERSTRWDRDDRLDRLANMGTQSNAGSQPNGHEALGDSSSSEQSRDSAKELTQAKAEAPPPPTEVTAEPQPSEPAAETQNQPAEQTKTDES